MLAQIITFYTFRQGGRLSLFSPSPAFFSLQEAPLGWQEVCISAIFLLNIPLWPRAGTECIVCWIHVSLLWTRQT